MLNKTATQSLDDILKGKVRPYNPNILTTGKKIKNSELRAIVEQMKNEKKLNETVILDFILELDMYLEKGLFTLKDLISKNI